MRWLFAVMVLVWSGCDAREPCACIAYDQEPLCSADVAAIDDECAPRGLADVDLNGVWAWTWHAVTTHYQAPDTESDGLSTVSLYRDGSGACRFGLGFTVDTPPVDVNAWVDDDAVRTPLFTVAAHRMQSYYLCRRASDRALILHQHDELAAIYEQYRTETTSTGTLTR